VPIRRFPFAPPPLFAIPYRCKKCGEINWLLPKEKVAETRCIACGSTGEFEKESIWDHLFPEIG